MLFFSVFVVGVVYIFARAWGFSSVGGLGLAGMALILSGVMNFFSYFYSDKLVMAISGAKQIKEKDNWELFHLVENLSIAAGLPTPKIYIVEDSAPNAFATGRNPKHAAIAFTTGILSKLNKQELEGVAAHELSHVNNRDSLLMTVVAVLVGLVALLADWFMRSLWFGGERDNDRNNNGLFLIIGILAAILAPIVGTLIQLAISRRREYLADASGAYLTRDPEQLAQALKIISTDKEPLESANRATAHLYVVNPFKGRPGQNTGVWLANLFNTHPPIEDRIKRLMEMEGQFK
ncbi:M48 family metallopeptidase [Candidatus Daviesbacteria bacterium]|nr:M48 family metallopeptidase [Candidatus Daviesbacteria bacterium]